MLSCSNSICGNVRGSGMDGICGNIHDSIHDICGNIRGIHGSVGMLMPVGLLLMDLIQTVSLLLQ
jgi:hypothetical protein